MPESQQTEEEFDRLFGPGPTTPTPGQTGATNTPAVSPSIPSSGAPEPSQLRAPVDEEFERIFGRREGKTELERLRESLDPEQLFRAENKRPGIALNTAEGLGPVIRGQLSMLRTKEDKMSFLEGKFPGEVRQSRDGSDFIVGIINDQGRVEDRKVDGFGKELLSDLADLGEILPLTAGAIAGIRQARKGSFGEVVKNLKGIKGVAVDSAIAGASGQGLMAGVDVTQRAVRGEDVQLGEVLTERGKLAAIDTVAGAGLAGVGKVVTRVVSPFGINKSVYEFDLEGAVKRLNDELGTDLILTPGEATGSRMLKKGEALAGELLGGNAIIKLKEASAQSAKRVQVALAGGDDAVLEGFSPVGRESIEALGSEGAALRAAVEAQKEVVVKEAQQEALNIAGQSSSAAYSPRLLGKVLNRGGHTLDSKNRTTTTDLYSNVAKEVGGGDLPVLVSETLEARAKAKKKVFAHFRAKTGTPKGGKNQEIIAAKVKREILKDEKAKLIKDMGTDPFPAVDHLEQGDTVLRLRQVTKELEEIEALASQTAKEPVSKKTGEKIIPSLSDPSVISLLDDLIKKGDEPWTLQELLNAKYNTDLKIQATQATTTVRDKHLIDISEMLRETIDEALAAHPNGTKATEALTAARAHVAKTRPLLDKAGVKELLDPNFEPTEFYKGMVRGNKVDEYFNLREFFGPNSEEMEILNSGIRNQLFADSTSVVDGVVDADAFFASLKSLVSKSPDLTGDVLGKNLGRLKQGEALRREILGENSQQMISAMRLTKLKPGSQFKVADLKTLMTSPRLGLRLQTEMNRLIKKQEQVDEAYRSSILRKIAKNEEGIEINPAEFVDNFARKATLKEVQAAMPTLRAVPGLEDRIARKTIESMLLRSRQSGSGTSTLTGDISELIDAEKFGKLVNSVEERAKLKELVGDKYLANLDDFLLVMNAKQGLNKGKGAGSIAGTMELTGLRKKGALGAASDWVKVKFISALMTDPRVRKVLTNTKFNQSNKDQFIAKWVLGGPFLNEITEDMGPINARNAAGALHDSISKWLDDNPGEAEKLNQPLTPQSQPAP